MTAANHVVPRGADVARRAIVAGLSLSLALSLAACGNTGTSERATEVATDVAAESSAETSSAEAEIHYLETANLFSDRDADASYDESTATKVVLADAGSTVDGTGARVEGSTITINDEGAYVVSGTLSDGQLVVDVADDQKVQIVLDGAQIASGTATGLYVRNADKVFLTLAEGTNNVVSATGAASTVDEKTLDGAIYASDTLAINGSGGLTVTGSQEHGIVCKNDLKLCAAGSVSVTAAKSALQAKESLRATGEGSYVLQAGTDGVHVEYAENDAATAEKGYIYLAGGTFDVTATNDGFDASHIMQVDGGTITVEAGDDGLHAESDLVVTGGMVDVTKCYEGLEGARIGIDDGDVKVVASDDGLNATGDDNENTTGDLTSDGLSSTTQGTGDTGGQDGQAPAGDTAMPEGGPGAGTPPALPDGESMDGATEGMEPPAGTDGTRTAPPSMPTGGRGPRTGDGSATADGQAIPTTDGGAATTGSSTDSQTTAEDGSAMGGRGWGGNGGMGGMMEADASALIRIAGGSLYVDSNGDGIDSNGKIAIAGGAVQVDGPVNTGNGALDCGTAITITGGTLLATSAGGMEENATSGTTQPTFLTTLGVTASGTVTVSDASGNEVASWSSAKQFSAVQVSSPNLAVGETYTIACGDVTTTVTLDDVVTGTGTGMGAMGGGRAMTGARGGDDARMTDGTGVDFTGKDGDSVDTNSESTSMKGPGHGSANGGRPVNGSPVNGSSRGNGSDADVSGSESGRSRERQTVADKTINTEVMSG